MSSPSSLPPPYYQDEFATIYHGDCTDLMPALGRFDAVIADPPYNETSLQWDRWPGGWVDACAAHSNALWCFGSLRMFVQRASEFSGWFFAQDLVWEKHNGSSPASDRFRRVHELVAQWYLGSWDEIYKSPVKTMDATKRTVRRKGKPPHWGEIDSVQFRSEEGGPRLMRSVQFVRSTHGSALHPTQKPEGIVRPLIEYSVPPGGTILSPFMGSGTDLSVARELGRRAVGIEADERYCEVAAKRMAQEVMVFP